VSRPVVWSSDAHRDIERIVQYLADVAPEYADKVVERIAEAATRLGLAQTGRPGRVFGSYEKSLPDIRYIIAYEFDRKQPDGAVSILRAIHMSQNWQPGTWPK